MKFLCIFILFFLASIFAKKGIANSDIELAEHVMEFDRIPNGFFGQKTYWRIGALTPKQATASEMQSEYLSGHQPLLSFGENKQDIWFRFTIRNATASDKAAYLQSPVIYPRNSFIRFFRSPTSRLGQSR
ncbi:MAG: hypothetical protein HRU19_22110 [Pseudobacteriovorax sp.]|nr:hypothetical protein [Pseudobacteriovorax sp.]